jgi:hypothetical protein
MLNISTIKLFVDFLSFTKIHKELKMFHQCSINSKLFCTFATDNHKQRKHG